MVSHAVLPACVSCYGCGLDKKSTILVRGSPDVRRAKCFPVLSRFPLKHSIVTNTAVSHLLEVYSSHRLVSLTRQTHTGPRFS